MDKLKKLEELKNLLDSDSITKEEYDSLKKEILETKGNDNSANTNTQESTSIKPWNKTGWGKIIQVLIWPLGLYMMFKVPYFSKTTRYIIAGILLFSVIMNGIGGGGGNQKACDCADILMLPRSSIKPSDRLYWDNCKYEFGGFSYANEQCVKSRR